MKETIAIDFDGVLAYYHKGWFDKNEYGRPIAGAKSAIKKLLKKYNLVIFTCRKKESILNWLKFYDFPILKVADKKPGAIQYIDDRGYKFTNWKEYFDNNQNTI